MYFAAYTDWSDQLWTVKWLPQQACICDLVYPTRKLYFAFFLNFDLHSQYAFLSMAEEKARKVCPGCGVSQARSQAIATLQLPKYTSTLLKRKTGIAAIVEHNAPLIDSKVFS